MPCVLRQSCSLEGKTMRSSSAANVVSGWKLSNAFRTASERSDTQSAGRAVQMAQKNPPFVDHFVRLAREDAAASALPRGQALAIEARRASLVDRTA